MSQEKRKYNTKISVLTVSRRMGWEKIAMESLAKQTFRDFEWVVVTEAMYNSAYLRGDNVIHLQAPKKTQVSNMNASENEGLRYCSGEYIVSYQDFIKLPKDCFQKLLDVVDAETFVTTLTKNASGPEDGRHTGVDTVRPCTAEEWETNVAIAPTKAFYELGGFDEEYDQGFAWDNVNLAQRAEMLGYKFKIDETNRPQLIEHDKSTVQPNGEFHAANMEKIRKGEKPIKLEYLL